MSAGVTGHALQVLFLAASVIWLVVAVRPGWQPHLRGRTVLVVALLLRVPFLFWGEYSDDLHRYVWEGRIQWEGHSPYAHAPADPALHDLRDERQARITHPELPTIYAPLAQMTFALAWKAGLREIGVRNLVLGLDLLVVVVLLGWLRATGRPPGWARVYAWCPLAVCSAAVGHIDPLMLLALAGCAWAWETRRPRAAAALLGAAILAKTMAVVCVPWLLLRRPRATLLVLVPVVALGYLPYWDGGGSMFATLVAFGRDFAFNGSLFRVAEWITPSATAARLVVAAVFVAWAAFVTVAQPRFAAAAALLFAGLLVLSPTVHFWYLTWYLVLLPAVGPRRWTWPLLAWAVSFVFASEAYRARHAGGPFAERFVLTWVEYAVPFACASWLLVRGWPRLPPLAPAPEAGAAAGGPGLPPGRFAVVIPCRGEAENLRTLVPAWLATPAARVVLADTPTGDGTEALARADARVVYHPVLRSGYGAAVLTGVAAAERKGDVEFIVVCDADHSRGPAQAAAILAPLADPRVGLVTAARIGMPLPPAQRLGNRLASLLIGLWWGVRFRDLGPFRAVRLAAWREWDVTDSGFGINVQMSVRALERGWRVREVALPGSKRAHGENRISGTWTGVLGAGYGILRRIYRLREPGPSAPLDATVVVLTKLPGHLPVKTRLVPALGEQGARDFYVEMLRDTLRLAPGAILAYSPPDADPRRALPELADLADGRFHPVAGDDGATCLENALAELYAGRPLVALGGDAPDLPRSRLEAAVTALDEYDVALVPTPDGGFSCLALRAPIAGLARGFTYGGGEALTSLRSFLEARGRETVCLAPWPDIDTPADLAAYRERQRAQASAGPSRD